MSNQAQFSVYSTGHSDEDNNANPVKQEFAKIFGISEAKAEEYIQKKKLIRKGLTQEQAELYQSKLEQIGMPTLIEPAITQAPAANESINKETAPPASEGFSLLPVDSEPEQGVSNVSGMKVKKGFACPKCDFEQDKAAECVKCGVIFDKLKEPSGSLRGERTSSTQTNSTQTNSAQTNSAHTKKDNANTRRHDSDEREGNVVIGLGAAAIVAAILAFVWKLIAIHTGYELGVVAWAVGGAIGFIAVIFGARGEVPAVACALLAAFAIIGGKYMIEQYYMEQVDSMFNGELREEIHAGYQEYQDEILAYQQIQHDDYSVKRFMSDYGYTNSDSVTEITDAELDEFRNDMAYAVADMDGMPDFEETMSQLQEVVTEEFASEASLASVMQNFGIIGIVFLFLGVGTAYRMVREA